MNQPADPITVNLRIPGQWAHPRELIERLPAGCRLTREGLILPDGTQVALGAMPADEQFAQIFRSSCRQPPAEDELAMVAGYTVNVCLSGPGGSLQAARAMMQAGAAVVRAGGAGVFIDNSALAHGGRQWLAMTEDGSPDALSFAFVALVRGRADVWTAGMHEKPVQDGHVIADLNGPRFQAFAEPSPQELVGHPVHNPFGRLRLKSMRDIAETN
jgi:hypothetical protein